MRYEEFVNVHLEKLRKASAIDFLDMPDISLYVDQASNFFKKQLEILDSETLDRYVSKNMIGRYVKHGLVPPLEKKHMTKTHMIMTAMVVYLRGIFEAEQLEQIMKPLVDNYNSDFDDKIDPELIYDSARRVNRKVEKIFEVEMDRSITDIKRYLEDTDLADDERAEIFVLILSLAMKADMEKYMADKLLEAYFTAPAKEKPAKFKMPKIKKQKKSKTAADEEDAAEEYDFDEDLNSEFEMEEN